MKKQTALFYICNYFKCTKEELKFHLAKDPLKVIEIMDGYTQLKVNEIVHEVMNDPRDLK